jgi:hypothetical protein
MDKMLDRKMAFLDIFFWFLDIFIQIIFLHKLLLNPYIARVYF